MMPSVGIMNRVFGSIPIAQARRDSKGMRRTPVPIKKPSRISAPVNSTPVGTFTKRGNQSWLVTMAKIITPSAMATQIKLRKSIPS